jgi:hypothetical protein
LRIERAPPLVVGKEAVVLTDVSDVLMNRNNSQTPPGIELFAKCQTIARSRL